MQSVMSGLIQRANSGLVINDGDYEENGLLHCGVCHKRKQFTLPNGTLVRCNCACDEAVYLREVAQRKRQEEADRIARLRSFGIASQKLRGASFDTDDGSNPAMLKLRRYAKKWDEVRVKNIGLLLYGGVGTGKSFGAACIANFLMEQQIPVMMTNFSSVLNSLSGLGEDRNEFVGNLVQYPLLILDDFGIERSTEYALEQVFNVIDSRYRTGLPLIVTTNLMLTEIQNPKDTAHARIYDRLLEMCTPIDFGSHSRRGGVAGQKFRAAAELLTED